MAKNGGGQGILERVFHLKEFGTNARTELIAGITTFFTMAYIIFVNPQILSLTGMDFNGVLMATIIASIVGTLIMAFVANVPYGLAPGMGLNAFFTFTVCFTMGFTWQQALALVLICGVINIIITFSGLRKAIIRAMPKILQAAIAGGIGMFIAYIGFKDLGLFKFTASGPFLSVIPGGSAITGPVGAVGDTVVGAAANTVPALVTFSAPSLILGMFGLVLMIILLVRHVKGAILIGILATTAIGIILDLTGVLGTPLTGIGNLNFSFASYGSTIGAIQNTAFKLDFAGLFAQPARAMLVVTAAVGFILTDIFDCIGTFIGTGKKSGIFDDADWQKFETGRNMGSRLDRALVADLSATTVGALVGTSNTTVYVESSAGIAEGGRTGLTSLVIAALFALCIVFSPFIQAVPSAATAPALIVVGAMMMSAFVDIDWKKLEIAIPAFLAAVIMPLSYSITNGIAFGFISYVIVKAVSGKVKEVHPIAWVVSGIFIVNFVLQVVFKI
ncbi:MAG: NCS2 family permease [Coriobacteriia bacterium]|nr:NCS2 family permease [Coriobacteriia bacterium]